ncbi:hypothetical protein TSA1_17645 [Bradyrhizobium nitroreducens]|uniref:Uncharacterized protein n=1 Tax=Bradyrhizobium nitroreducens TaxID=709803 RepID=A0A2M6UCS3_9BRAD|nr:hypothetical protein [Bradyrhizobium nitroreducens]PIT02379.1 hypothetical protein TSA1_17645 [Bradyrhizobium nitroreducens]
MLRMALLGLLILLSVGMLSAMELRTPPRRVTVIAEPPAEQTTSPSASHGALAKADRLEISAVSSETPTQAPPAEDRIAPSQDVHIGSSEPKPTVRHRHHPKKLATAQLKPKPRAIPVKQAANPQRSKAAGNPEPCRLKAFGGLLKALNMSGCEI